MNGQRWTVCAEEMNVSITIIGWMLFLSFFHFDTNLFIIIKRNTAFYWFVCVCVCVFFSFFLQFHYKYLNIFVTRCPINFPMVFCFLVFMKEKKFTGKKFFTSLWENRLISSSRNDTRNQGEEKISFIYFWNKNTHRVLCSALNFFFVENSFFLQPSFAH